MTEEELTRLETLAAAATGWCHRERYAARRMLESDGPKVVPALIAEVRRLRVELARTEADARTALDALHARCDAAERAAETARDEEREACARVAQDASRAEQEMRDWLRGRGMPCVESHVRHETADLIARQIRARGGV